MAGLFDSSTTQTDQFVSKELDRQIHSDKTNTLLLTHYCELRIRAITKSILLALSFEVLHEGEYGVGGGEEFGVGYVADDFGFADGGG